MLSGEIGIGAVVRKTAVLILLLILAFKPAFAVGPTSASRDLNGDSKQSHLYKIEIQKVQRHNLTGAERSYTLYVPKSKADLPGPPYPMIVMAHGFLMSGTQQSNNARYLAERGFVVLSPNLSRILLGDEKRLQNIKDILDQISWISGQTKVRKSSLYGLVDPGRVGVAGNSSGGAVCLELVIQAQKAKIPIQAMCSMDGAPWDRSWDSMPKLAPLKILSLRADPSICNEYARILNFLRSLKFPFDDIKIIGAHHCDAENPTTIRCMCICGRSRSQYRELFQLLTYLFFRDTFDAPRIAEPTKSLLEVASDLQNSGRVTVHLNQRETTKVWGIHDRPEDE